MFCDVLAHVSMTRCFKSLVWWMVVLYMYFCIIPKFGRLTRFRHYNFFTSKQTFEHKMLIIN